VPHWNPQDYAQHSRGQEAWAKELLTQVELRADDVVLDVDCGDGRNTATIAASVPNGRVLGVDLSADMVAHAATQHCRPPANNLRFAQAHAGEAWHRYTSRAPLDLRDSFVADAADSYTASHPPDEQGRIHVSSRRCDCRCGPEKPGNLR
jgi:trans-aconitate methyltransferase